MPRKLAIIGKGNVGQALGEGWERAGHEVRHATEDPDRVHEAVAWADIVVLAVPWKALEDIARAEREALQGKIVVDVTNLLTEDMELALGFRTSGAEELQKQLPGAKVVKALNTAFAQTMRSGQAHGERLSAFVASDDPEAKQTVLQLVADLGFDAVDAGPLESARYLEPVAMLNIFLGYGMGMGSDMGLRLLR